MNKRSKREIGDELESYLEENFPDYTPTKNSGALNLDNDGKHPIFTIEAKNQPGNSGFTIKKSEWDKLRTRSRKMLRDPMLVIQNKDNERLCVIELDTMISLIKKEYDYKASDKKTFSARRTFRR